MSDPVPLACPFDGYATPFLVQGEPNNDGTHSYHVICPICNNGTPDERSMTIACNLWNQRNYSLATYVAWFAAFDTFVATVPTMSNLAAYVHANPPTTD